MTNRFNICNLLILTALIFTCACSKSNDNHEFDIQYIPVKIDPDSDWSLISKDGKVIFEDEFKQEPSLVINGLFYVKEDDGFCVYRTEGDKPEPVDGLEKLSYVGYLNDGLMPVTFPGKRISIVDKDGKEQFKLNPVKGKEIVQCVASYIDHMLIVSNEDNKSGYFNTNGECVIEPMYDFAGFFAEDKSVVYKDSVWSVINKKNEKLFSLKKNQHPANIPMFKDDCIITVDKDSVFYAYNGKGEMSKLSSKIKQVVDYKNKYLIYIAKNGDYGMMTFDGDVVVRAKYKSLTFGADDQLIAQRDENQYELLDFEGKTIQKLDYDKIEYIRKFGYVAGSGGDYAILNINGKKIDNSTEFSEYGNVNFPQILSCYIPGEKLIKQIVELITPQGIGDFKFGTPMSAIASSMGYDINNVANSNACNLSMPLEQHGNYLFALNLFSYQVIAGRNFYNQALWNPNSTVDIITLIVETAGSWGNKGVNEIVNIYKTKGYSEVRHVENKGKILYILNNGDTQMFINNMSDHQIAIIYGHGINDMMTNAIINDFYTQTNSAQ